MNEFEWLRQLRDLRQPQTPQHDLWAAISAVVDDRGRANADTSAPNVPRGSPTRSTPATRWWLAGGLAASLLLAGGIGWQLAQSAPGARVANTTAAQWTPADPRLRGAAIELDAARMELGQALTQAPHSPALRRLLTRTEHQQAQLHELTHEAG
ncbi:MAG TPA: hypothetical protein VLZ55_07425 [Rhodanobacter sp.]|nr:hypothetical protein [Rhodanobacter sp.]